jgi:hypothetical protein
MAGNREHHTRGDGDILYEVKVKGRLDESWTEWFKPMRIIHTDDGDTIIKGLLPDQAALQGLLINLGNLNLELISVNPAFEE